MSERKRPVSTIALYIEAAGDGRGFDPAHL
jgi:hypothetical protein